MSRSLSKPPKGDANSPAFWFACFVAAIEDGAGVEAWNAQKELHRLGYVVTLRRVRGQKGGAR